MTAFATQSIIHLDNETNLHIADRLGLAAVYMMYCAETQRAYIGSASNWGVAVSRHRSRLETGYHKKKGHQLGIAGGSSPAGLCKIRFVILEFLELEDEELLKQREKEWINKIPCLLNERNNSKWKHDSDFSASFLHQECLPELNDKPSFLLFASKRGYKLKNTSYSNEIYVCKSLNAFCLRFFGDDGRIYQRNLCRLLENRDKSNNYRGWSIERVDYDRVIHLRSDAYEKIAV